MSSILGWLLFKDSKEISIPLPPVLAYCSKETFCLCFTDSHIFFQVGCLLSANLSSVAFSCFKPSLSRFVWNASQKAKGFCTWWACQETLQAQCCRPIVLSNEISAQRAQKLCQKLYPPYLLLRKFTCVSKSFEFYNFLTGSSLFFLLSRWFFGTLQVEMISSRNLIFAERIYIYLCIHNHFWDYDLYQMKYLRTNFS